MAKKKRGAEEATKPELADLPMFRAELPPEIIYALSKAGVVVTDGNRDVVAPDDPSWDAAAENFLTLEPVEQAATLQAIRIREAQ